VHQSGASLGPALEVVLLYEDLGTALRAKHSLEMLRDQFVAGAGLAIKVWRLDLLAVPLLAEQAANEAAAADVIVLSLHGRDALRAEVKDWLRRWLDRKEPRAYALAALLDPEPNFSRTESPVTAYLKEAAQEGRVEWLCTD
jgi:hypothetical protein